MQGFETGDHVRIDIPDETDPDYDRLHGTHGTVVGVFNDDAAQTTGDPRDGFIYSVELNSGSTEQFRWRDLRPLPQE